MSISVHLLHPGDWSWVTLKLSPLMAIHASSGGPCFSLTICPTTCVPVITVLFVLWSGYPGLMRYKVQGSGPDTQNYLGKEHCPRPVGMANPSTEHRGSDISHSPIYDRPISSHSVCPSWFPRVMMPFQGLALVPVASKLICQRLKIIQSTLVNRTPCCLGTCNFQPRHRLASPSLTQGAQWLDGICQAAIFTQPPTQMPVSSRNPQQTEKCVIKYWVYYGPIKGTYKTNHCNTNLLNEGNTIHYI